MKTIISIIVLAIVAILGLVYFNAPKQVAESPSPSASPTPTPQPTDKVKVFDSSALGITFQYNPHPAEDINVAVAETASRAYVYTNNTEPKSGQFVEILQKKTTETFSAAIKRIILAKYPSPKCTIKVSPSNIYPSGYSVAEITYPKPTNSADPIFSNYALCNPNYDQVNGIRYFLYSTATPDKFAFFDIGQYGIPVTASSDWQDTFRFK